MLKFNKWTDKTLTVVTALALILMMLHIVAHALSRFLFQFPLHGTNELVGYWYLPAVALLGLPAAHLQREQITVTLVIDKMKDQTARYYKAFVYCLGALASIGFAWFGLIKAIDSFEMGSAAGVTDIITWPVHFLVPIVFALLAILYIVDLLVILRKSAAHQEDVQKDDSDDRANDYPTSGKPVMS